MGLERIAFVILTVAIACGANTLSAEEDSLGTSLGTPGASSGRYSVEGRVYAPDDSEHTEWQLLTRVQLNSGEFLGFLKQDGSFVISNVPSGSYILEILNPDYMYEPVRVEINSKGKFRARKVNHILTSVVIQVPYPLRMKAASKIKYFHVREQWRLTDFLFNPMVLMMVLPLILIMILPKMMNDPETKKEMEQLSNFRKIQDMPDVSELITSLFSSQPAKANPKVSKVTKKRQ